MGRYLALGVASSVYLRRDERRCEPNFDFKKNEKRIKDNLSKMLDITKYNIAVDKDYMCLEIKPDDFNNNINDLIEELNPLIRCNVYVEKKESKTESGDVYDSLKELGRMLINEKPKYEMISPLTIKKYEKDDGKHRAGYIYSEWNDLEEWPDYYAAPEQWLFDDEELKDKIKANISYILLWQDWDKISGEDETKLLSLMNIMSRKYFSSSLSKNIFFFIFG